MSRKPSSGIGRGKGKRAAKAKASAKGQTREMTSEEILQSNIKITERIAAQGLMPEGALNYSGTSEEQTKYYEAVDRIYKRLPEGYGYSFREEALQSGKKEKFIQVEKVSKFQKYDYRTGKMKTVRNVSMIFGRGRVYLGVEGNPNATVSQLLSQSALRGYAKAQVYRVAGKVYDFKTKGVSEKYPELDSYGKPKKRLD